MTGITKKVCAVTVCVNICDNMGKSRKHFFIIINVIVKGRAASPKLMNFWKSSKRGGGSFPIQKFMLQILDLKIGLFSMKMIQKELFQNFISFGDAALP